MTLALLRVTGAWLCLGCAAQPQATDTARNLEPARRALAPDPESTVSLPAEAAPAASARTEPSAPNAEASGAVVLTTYFEFLGRDGARRPLLSGDSLRSGDRFALLVSVREPLYVYILYAGSDGSATVLYPEHGDVTLEPGPARRFPGDQDFELDAVPGWERLLVVASREPLSKSENALATLVASVRSSRQWPEAAEPSAAPALAAGAPPPRTAPSTARPAGTAPVKHHGPAQVLEGRTAGADYRGITRGVHLTAAGSGRIDAIPDARGVVAIPFFIRHLP